MMDTKELLRKIAALRMRLDADADARPADPARAIEDKLHAGAVHNRLIESTLKSAAAGEPAAEPAALRLSGRGARLLRKGRESLLALREIADDPAYQAADDGDALEHLHREGMAMIETILRTAQAFPASMSVQLRLCDGLEVVLAEVDERITMLRAALEHRRRQAARIDTLAECLRRLSAKQPLSLTPLQALADLVIAEARANEPLQFLYAAPMEPARFTAAHSLSVAQVLARLIEDDAEWQPQLQLAVMAALVHDVGMSSVPAEVLLTEGPLDGDERRLIEKHTIVAETMLERLWPGGGWPIEAATGHHERNDGTGYPLGKTAMQLSPIVRLIAVCDVYAALCAPRPHRGAFDTRTAMTETLLLAERDYLDKEAAERLLWLSFYPVGSAVELNDGAIGLVLATHADARGLSHPDKPIVHLVQNEHGQPAAWPNVIDLLEQKDRRILRGLGTSERRSRLGRRYSRFL